MSENYRMFVELPNGARFRAKGAVSEVRVDLDRFYELLLEVPKPTATNGNGTPHAPDLRRNETLFDAAEQRPQGLENGLDQVTLDRLFAKDKNGTISCAHSRMAKTPRRTRCSR